MSAIKQLLRTTSLISLAFLVALSYPLAAFAEDVVPTPDTTTAATAPIITDATATSSGTTVETTQPPTTAADSVAPVQDTPGPAVSSVSPGSTETVSLPPTSQPAPPKPTYAYDAATGHWNTTQWVYDAASGTYKKVVTPVEPPDATLNPLAASSPGGIVLDASTTSALANAIGQSALTGDASVLHNTTAGNAITGNASSAATIINNVNSSLSNSANQQAANFVTNITGDVNGDIILQPMLLKAMLEAQAQPASPTTLHSVVNTGINNTLNLGATSGNALVSGNTLAGNAVSGSANTVANVVNIVNSMVAANQSFVGTINVYGNLNGDILIAPDFIPQLLASNAGGGSAAPAGTSIVNASDTQAIVNTIALAASTGQALVTGNSSAGNATSGTAMTNTVIFNLTNHDIIASNSLLVFVNVLGRWVGVIVDAPVGATAGAIGNGVSSNTVAPNLVINANNNTLVTNNINLASQTGDATVSHNTSAGGATTGNATASANVANILGSHIGLSGWFGVLFINVYGSWEGSFGIDTSAGNALLPMHQSGTILGAGSQSVPQVIRFVPRQHWSSATVVQGSTVSTLGTSVQVASAPAAVQPSDVLSQVQMPPIHNLADWMPNWPLVFGSLVLVGGSVLTRRKAI